MTERRPALGRSGGRSEGRVGRCDGGALRVARAWVAAGVAGFCLLPWYALQDGVESLGWVAGLAGDEGGASGLFLVLLHGVWWLAPVGAALALAVILVGVPMDRRGLGHGLVAVGLVGLAVLFAQGFAIGLRGWSWPVLEHAFGPLDRRQFGVGAGAVPVGLSFLFLVTTGAAALGRFRGDLFVAGAVGLVVLLIGLFTAFPILRILALAVGGDPGGGSGGVAAVWERLAAEKIWGLGCVAFGHRCGVAWNTLFLAAAVGATTTALGLASALIVARTGFAAKRLLRMVAILPIITPPFVIGLGLILIFGRAGLVNQGLEWAFGISAGRWIYGFQGVFLAQVFAFTPIAFLVLAGVVQGISPSLEEAAQTLRADTATTFRTVSLPLMLPGLANAFLVGFIESIADFGNPIVLGGDYGVLSTEIFFAITGAQLDYARAATLSAILLAFALGAFWLQRRVLGTRSYTSLTGKGDPGLAVPLPAGWRRASFAVALPWIALTLVVYAMALVGGFVETWGRDYTPTLRHYAKAFSVDWTEVGLVWSGAAWNSLWTTLRLAAIAAPITAAIGLLIAWLLTRQRFAGRDTFEFATMMSFAVPGTVIGVSYIMAFNVPPLELTGTGLILVLCFVFRNMPVGVRAGMASMAQIDRSLDDASLMLRGRSATTLRRVILPLLRPAVVAALVYSFVRAVTTVSAVVFLVTAEYEMATTYIILRVINGDYGVAIAYSSVLIVLMLAVIVAIQLAVGERRLGRRPVAAPLPAGRAA